MPLDIKIKGLDNELTLILHNYIKHRETLNTIDQSEEAEKELELRTKQYEDYRNYLFLKLYENNVDTKPLWKATNWNKRFANVEKIK